MQIILDNNDISRLNEILGSLMIKQFDGNQKQYRAFITAIMQEYFKTNLEFAIYIQGFWTYILGSCLIF